MQKKQIVYEVIFFVYLMLLIWIVLFKMEFSLANIFPVREINYIPFYYDVIEGDAPVYEFILNAVAFIPFGFLLAKAFRNISFGEGIAVTFAVSLAFETLQYVLSVGVSDITDLIMNTLGGAVGIWLASVIYRKQKPKKIKKL